MAEERKPKWRNDTAFLASRMDTFIELVQDPNGYFKRNPHTILPKSFDLKIVAAALYLLVDCYLKGRGLKYHPRSKTLAEARDALSDLWEDINKKVEARPYLYPKLSGAIGRGQASVDIDWLVDGYSKWSE